MIQLHFSPFCRCGVVTEYIKTLSTSCIVARYHRTSDWAPNMLGHYLMFNVGVYCRAVFQL